MSFILEDDKHLKKPMTKKATSYIKHVLRARRLPPRTFYILDQHWPIFVYFNVYNLMAIAKYKYRRT